MDQKSADFAAVYDQQRNCPVGGRQWTYAPVNGTRPAGASAAPPAAGAEGTQSAPGTGAGAGILAPSEAARAVPLSGSAQPAPLTLESTEYLNGFLRTQIGRRVRVQFLLGSNTFTDKAGLLLDVGANYILLQEADSDDLLVCDFFNIRFVTIYR